MSRIKVTFVFLVAFAFAASAQDGVSRYDGRWWQSIAGDSQNAFLAGYYDCYIWDARGTAYSDGSLVQEAASISSYYQSSVGAEHTPVLQVIKKLNAGHKHAVINGKDRHGENDGDYWRQMGRKERLAFLEGYILCQRNCLHVSFSKPIESYLNDISKWYGVSDKDASELNPKTGNDKIANVLLRLRDKSKPVSLVIPKK